MEYLFLHIENKDRYFNNLEIFIIWIHCIPFPPVGGTITKTNPSFGEKYLFALHRCIVKIYSTSDKRNISNCKKIFKFTIRLVHVPPYLRPNVPPNPIYRTRFVQPFLCFTYLHCKNLRNCSPEINHYICMLKGIPSNFLY